MARRVLSTDPQSVATLAFATSPNIAPEANVETIGVDTRERLLEAAGEVFAARGYQNATVREICTRARANVAAINYHFGDKESLYSETLQYAFRFAVEKYPLGMGTEANATAEQKLVAFIHNYLDRLLDEGRPAWHGQLISREMVDPTPALDAVINNFVRPQQQGLAVIVGEILGGPAKPATAEQLRIGVCSVVGQCVFYKHCRPVLSKMMPEIDYTPAGRKVLAEHLATFSIAGLKALAAKSR